MLRGRRLEGALRGDSCRQVDTRRPRDGVRRTFQLDECPVRRLGSRRGVVDVDRRGGECEDARLVLTWPVEVVHDLMLDLGGLDRLAHVVGLRDGVGGV